jgi:lipase maturation factor 1
MQWSKFINAFRWLFDGHRGPRGQMAPRWIFLRALALIYFSAFYSLLIQIKGLIGPEGILPAQDYLADIAQQPSLAQLFGLERYWYAPSLYWISSSSTMMTAVTWIGLIAAVIAFLNVWPRLSFFICFVCFLSFVGASSVFSSYQSDGMLLEAGFLALFFAPRGLLPGWGANSPPSRMSWFLLQWEWFRIYFESGIVKLVSGDVQWRNFTAMDEYYQNGPLPTWIGWYVEHLPHWFHAATVGGTLALELGLVFMMFFPRKVRLILFLIVTPWEIGVILTANYAFLNYLVLSLGFLLLDDRFLLRFVPARLRPREPERISAPSLEAQDDQPLSILGVGEASLNTADIEESAFTGARRSLPARLGFSFWVAALAFASIMLTWIAYNTTAELVAIPLHDISLPQAPLIALEPFRIANQYGLFAVMTRGRYEIEFQGSSDGSNWTAYQFQNKPQALNEAPGIYAPYQPRFEWNLWFASLGGWRDNEIVPLTEERLLVSDGDVLALFRGDPFPQIPPRYVRAVIWQYWFTTMDEKRRTGDWWRRVYLGLYAPEITMAADGHVEAVEMPGELPPHD